MHISPKSCNFYINNYNLIIQVRAARWKPVWNEIRRWWERIPAGVRLPSSGTRFPPSNPAIRDRPDRKSCPGEGARTTRRRWHVSALNIFYKYVIFTIERSSLSNMSILLYIPKSIVWLINSEFLLNSSWFSYVTNIYFYKHFGFVRKYHLWILFISYVVYIMLSKTLIILSDIIYF